MPRADRYMMEGYVYHLTHRCHNRAFLILDKEGLLELLDGVPAQSFRSAHAAGINERVAAGGMLREPAWTDGLAVGSRSYVERVAREANRMQIEYSELPNPAGSNGWWVRESAQNAYGSEPAGKAPSNSWPWLRRRNFLRRRILWLSRTVFYALGADSGPGIGL